MLKLGAETLDVYDIDAARMRTLVSTLSALFPSQRIREVSDLRAVVPQADGLVHATTTGMLKNPGLPLPIELLTSRHWVVEIVYFPLETELLKAARTIGCRTLDGGGMAIFQAVGAFRLFTGVSPDAERMARHFDQLARGRRNTRRLTDRFDSREWSGWTIDDTTIHRDSCSRLRAIGVGLCRGRRIEGGTRSRGSGRMCADGWTCLRVRRRAARGRCPHP